MDLGNPLVGVGRATLVPGNKTVVAAGAKIYAKACASCHGDNLQGQANWQVRNAEGKLPAPPHDETGHTWHHPDQQIFEITKLGVQFIAGDDYATDMPPFGDVYSDDDIIGNFPATLTPVDSLDTLNGENGTGDWTISLFDTYAFFDTGTLNLWSVNLFCANQ